MTTLPEHRCRPAAVRLTGGATLTVARSIADLCRHVSPLLIEGKGRILGERHRAKGSREKPDTFKVARFPIPDSHFLFPNSHFPITNSQLPLSVLRFTNSHFPFSIFHFPFPISQLPFTNSQLPFTNSHLPFTNSHLPFPNY
jgi:hypothetical protein